MKKGLYILILLLISILCIGSVSAIDVDNGSVDSDISVNDLKDPIDTSKSFSDIQNLIDSASEGDVIALDGIYSGSDVIKVNKTVTIKGSDGTIIDGKNSTYRIFDISGNNVILENLIICNADFKQEIEDVNYGAIYNEGNNLLITKCTFINNTVKHPICSIGGAIANYGNNSVIDNCIFENNSAYTEEAQPPSTAYGGAIANYGDNFTVKNSYFKSNIACDLSQSGDMGGAIYSESDLTTIDSCVFIANEAKSGSAIYTNDPVINNKLVINNCSFFNQSAAESLATYTFNVYLTNSTFAYNDGTQGGAARINSGYSVFIDGCSFIKNQVNGNDVGTNDGFGGAIIFSPGMESNLNYTIINSIFYKNIAETAGSALAFSLDSNSNVTMNINNNSFISSENNRNVSIIEIEYYSTNNLDVDINNNIFDGYNSSVIVGKLREDFAIDNLFDLNVDSNYWSMNNTDSFPNLVRVNNNYMSPNDWVLMSIYSEIPHAEANNTFYVVLDTLCKGNGELYDFDDYLPNYAAEVIKENSNEKISVIIPSGERGLFTSYIPDTTEFDYVVVSHFTDKEEARINVKPIYDPNIHVVVIGDKKITLNTGDIFIIKYKLFNDGKGIAKDLLVSFRIPEGLEFIDSNVDYGSFDYSEQNEAYGWYLDEVGVNETHYLAIVLKAVNPGNYQITPIVGWFEEVPSVVDTVDITVKDKVNPSPKPTSKDNNESTLPNTGNPLFILLIALSAISIGSLKRKF